MLGFEGRVTGLPVARFSFVPMVLTAERVRLNLESCEAIPIMN